MTEVMLWDPMERFFWGVAITVLFITILQYIKKGKKGEIFKERIFMYGFAVYLLGYTLSFIFIYLADLLIPGNFRNGIFYGEVPDLLISDFILLFLCANLSTQLSTLFFIIIFENIIKRTKYLFSIITFTFTLFYIILLFNQLRIDLFYTIYTFFTSILLSYILYYAAKRTQFEFKGVSLVLFMGILLILLSGVYFPLGLSAPPVLVIIGASILLFPTYINPNFFSRTLRFWVFIGILTICFLIISLLYIGDFRIDSIFSTLPAFIVVYFLIRNIRSEATLEPKGEQSPGLLGIITRPQRITEEEVSISIEKKICLVCKGKLGGVLFMCTECGALYCITCSEALIRLENLCWACDSPIDTSKPVKPFKEEKKEVGIEVMEDSLKNPKK